MGVALATTLAFVMGGLKYRFCLSTNFFIPVSCYCHSNCIKITL
ncbi:hypothetical protein [Vibrio rarus]